MIFCVSFVKIFVCIKKCRTFAALFPVTSDANQVIGFYFFFTIVILFYDPHYSILDDIINIQLKEYL